MAVVNTKSTRVTNADAAVQTLDKIVVNHGRKRSTVGFASAVSGDSIASTYRLARVNSAWRINAIRLYCSAITTCAGSFGLYKIASAGGAVVGAATYATGQSLATAVTATDITYVTKAITAIENQVWQDAALTSDPNVWYDLTCTLTAAAGSNGTIAVEVEYVAND